MMSLIAGGIFAWLSGGANPEVTKRDVLKLLSSHQSEATILTYIRQHAPAELLSAQDLADLAAAGASDAVLQELIASASPDGPQDGSAGYVLESPSYYPYYYDYYDNYFPFIYGYPAFTYFFYNPSYYRNHYPERYEHHPYTVRSFPYFSHPGWMAHPGYPYHAYVSHGYHPWHDPGPVGHAAPPGRSGGWAGPGSAGGHH